MRDTCNVQSPVPPNEGLGSEDGGEWGGGWKGRGWHKQAIPSVAPPVSSKAPSSNSGVVQAQSCLSRRQVTPAVPGCGGRLDNGVSSLADPGDSTLRKI